MEVLKNIAWFSPLFPLLLGWRYRRYTPVWIFCLVALSCDTLTYFIKQVWFPDMEHRFNLGNVFALSELLTYGFFFYYYLFDKNRLFLLVVLALSVIFILHTVLNSIYKFNLSGLMILSLFYIGCSLFGFRSILIQQRILRLERSFVFWTLVGIFTFSSGAFFVYLVLSQILYTNQPDVIYIWFLIYASVNILRYLLLGIGLYQKSD